jgi:hypothetical protein
MTTAELSLSVLVSFNAGALIWGAATLKNEVRNLKDVVQEMKIGLNSIITMVSDHDGRLLSAEKDGTRALDEVEGLRGHIVSAFEDLRKRISRLEVIK